MDCKKASSLIVTDYVDGRMKGRDLEEMEAHIRSCVGCSALAGRAAQLHATFSAAPRQEAPPSLWRKIRDEITIDPVRVRYRPGLLDRLRNRLTMLRPAVVMACAAILLICVVAVIRFMPISGPSSAGAGQDELITIASMNGVSEESEYDLGTRAEEYFL